MLAIQPYNVLQVYQVHNTRKQQYNGGRWRYKLIVPLKFAKVYNNKERKFEGGPWHYKR